MLIKTKEIAKIVGLSEQVFLPPSKDWHFDNDSAGFRRRANKLFEAFNDKFEKRLDSLLADSYNLVNYCVKGTRIKKVYMFSGKVHWPVILDIEKWERYPTRNAAKRAVSRNRKLCNSKK